MTTPYAGMIRIRLRVGAALRTLSARLRELPWTSINCYAQFNAYVCRLQLLSVVAWWK